MGSANVKKNNKTVLGVSQEVLIQLGHRQKQIVSDRWWRVEGEEGNIGSGA